VVGIEEVMEILEEASQVIEYSHGLEQKSRELEALTAELREANQRLQELDHMKDDFLSTVSHELRTPLTSIRSFSEILFDNPDLGVGDRRKFLAVIVKESERLIQVLVNLLSNAAKFCDEKTGYVTVTAESRLEGLQISVADNGRGVPPDNRQLIFEKFQQVSETLTEKPRGTGLGLTISRQIVEHFGGRIWAESTPGQGARFCVVLPGYREIARPAG
jgi:signal transduction histidine kinase